MHLKQDEHYNEVNERNQITLSFNPQRLAGVSAPSADITVFQRL